MTRRRAFTLIETLAVVVILAVLATAVTLSLAHAAQRTTFHSIIEQVAHLDRTTRRYCLQHGRRATLAFDTRAQSVRRLPDTSAQPLAAGSTLHLTGATLDRIRVHGSGADADPALRFTPQGRSPTYALRFTAPPDRLAWLVVSGLTGEVVSMSDDEQVDAFFVMLGGASP